MPLKTPRAKRWIRKSREAVKHLGDFQGIPEGDFVGRQRKVLKARAKEGALKLKVDKYTKRLSKIDTHLAATEHGLWGTRWIRRGYWNWRAGRNAKKLDKYAGKLSVVQGLLSDLESAYKDIYKAESQRLTDQKKIAVEKMNFHLRRVAAKIRKHKKQMQGQLNAIRTTNANNPPAAQLPAALFDQLKSKIESESPDLKGAFHLVQINKGMQKLLLLVAAANPTEATTEINRLIGFNKNPPS